MDALENIRERRSVRKYSEKKVSTEIICEIVQDAAYAPSWMNFQSVGYIAILNPEMKNKVAGCMAVEYNMRNVRSAPAVVILISQDHVSGFMADHSELAPHRAEHWQSFDAGIAAQTFCLAAHARGLGTLIMGIWDEEGLRRVVGIPEDCRIAAVIAVGYAEGVQEVPRRKSLDELLSFR